MNRSKINKNRFAKFSDQSTLKNAQNDQPFEIDSMGSKCPL